MKSKNRLARDRSFKPAANARQRSVRRDKLPRKPWRNLLAVTLTQIVCFSIWGLLSPLLPLVMGTLTLSIWQVSVLASIPVLTCAIGRLFVGLLADRWGGKTVMVPVLLTMPFAAFALGTVMESPGYSALMITGALLGVAGASFSAASVFVSGWFAPDKQGTALGLFGMCNGGVAVSTFFLPVLVARLGATWAVWMFGILSAVAALGFCFLAEDAPSDKPQRPLAASFRPLKAPMTYVLSLLYAQTFGGFLVLTVYSPLLLKEAFGFLPAAAGLVTAVIILLATFVRPIGGYLSDRFGSRPVLTVVFSGLLSCAIMMVSQNVTVFLSGAFAAAILFGLGNGAVFKLIPQSFPQEVGAVTGIVAAVGVLGGFFPPLFLGYLKELLGSFAGGFYLMFLFSACCLVVVLRTVSKNPASRRHG